MYSRVSNLSQRQVLMWALAATTAIILVFFVYRFIGTVVFGLFVYYASRPIYRRVLNRVNHPNIAASATLFLFAFPFLFLLAYTVIVAITEFSTIINTIDGTGLNTLLQSNIELKELANQPIELAQSSQNADTIRDLFEVAIAYAAILAEFLLHMFLIIIFAFYMLRDGYKLRAKFYRSLPRSPELLTFLEDVDRDFQTLFFGNILHAILSGVIGAVTYTALSVISPPGVPVPYPVLMGALAGVASLVPIVGMKIVYIPVTAALLASSLATNPETYWFPVLFFGVSMLIIDGIPDFLIRPYVSGDRLHMGALIFAYVIGPIVFGWYGLFYGPILLVVVSNFFNTVFPVLFEPTYALPGSSDPGTERDDGERLKELPPGDDPDATGDEAE